MNHTMAERFLEARLNKGFTQKQVAESIYVTPQAVSLWEKGDSMPDIDKLSNLAALFDVSIDWLVNGQEVDERIKRVTDHMSDRLFNEDRMYTYLKGYLSGQGLHQSLRLLPYIKEKHQGQDRRGKEHVPYFSHPLQLASHAVALGLNDDPLVSTALLHDVCEDCGVGVEELPVDEETKVAVALLTKSDFPQKPMNPTAEQLVQYETEKKRAEEKYYLAIRENRIATIVKLLDRCHNLSGMACAWPPEKLAGYILETEEFIYPLMEYAKHTYTENYNQIYLIKYHMRSVVETIRHILPSING